MKIGIIGLGIVGKAAYDVLSKYHEVVGYDKYKQSDRQHELFNCEAIFVATPTPEGKDGRLDCSTILEVLRMLEEFDFQGVVAVKSTVRLRFFEELNTKLRIVYDPEFLHWKNSRSEFENPVFIVLAGNSRDLTIIKKVYSWVTPDKFEILTFEEAEMVKLAMNAFATTKISFWNEMKILCDEVKVDVNKIRDLLRKDVHRWSDEYTDPLRGPYGGVCLPKDVREIINFSKNAVLLRAVEEVNEKTKKTKIQET